MVDVLLLEHPELGLVGPGASLLLMLYCMTLPELPGRMVDVLLLEHSELGLVGPGEPLVAVHRPVDQTYIHPPKIIYTLY